MHLKTSSKILNELPSLLELSTGRWVEAQNAQQEKAICAQQSEWTEPGDAGLQYEGLQTRVFAFIIDKTQGPSVRIAIRCQSVNGANQILTLGFDADPQLIKYEMLRLSLQENLVPMNNIHADLFTRYPSRTDKILNSELNQYCADHMLVRNKPTIDLRLNALNAGNLSFRKVAPGDDYALFHSVNPILRTLTDTPDQPRICFRHLHIMPADHSVVPANNDMSNVQHFDVFAPVADAMNDVVRFSLVLKIWNTKSSMISTSPGMWPAP